MVLVGTGMRPIPPTGYGGVERTIAEFAAALRAAGDDVRIVHEPHPGRLGEIRFAGHLARYRSILEGGIVHAHTPIVADRLARLQLPFTYTTHSRHWFVRTGWAERRGYHLEQAAVRHAAASVAVTDRVRDAILASIDPPPAGPVVTIPLGVDLERFHPRSPGGQPETVLGVGAVLPIKRWHLAAGALRGTGITMRLAGPVLDAAYARTVQAAGPVQLLGEVPDERLVEEYERAGCLVHPSSVELFPGVVAQAMACGRPVVGSEAIAAVADAPRAAVVLPDRPDDELRAAYRTEISRLLADEPRRIAMGQAARASAEERFRWKSVVLAHHELYRRVGLAPRRSSPGNAAAPAP